MAPSRGHVKRVCKIWRSELWRQVRLYTDWLRVTCYAQYPGWIAQRRFQCLRREASHLTEIWWNCNLKSFLGAIGKSKTPVHGKGSLTVMGGASIPSNISNILQKGPKFGLEPSVPPHELMALNRNVAKKAPQEDRGRTYRTELTA